MRGACFAVRAGGAAIPILVPRAPTPPDSDGVLAYFGYPQAREHDAKRAVRAGLAVVETVPKLDTGASVPLQVRIVASAPSQGRDSRAKQVTHFVGDQWSRRPQCEIAPWIRAARADFDRPVFIGLAACSASTMPRCSTAAGRAPAASGGRRGSGGYCVIPVPLHQ